MMTRLRRSVCRLVAFIACLVFVLPLFAQTAVSPEDEYKKQLRVTEDIRPLGENPFGEQVSLYNGALSFVQNDVTQPGNGLPIQIERTFQPAEVTHTQDVYRLIENAFVDWSLTIPHIETLSAENKWTDSSGHQVKYWNFLDNTARCSVFEDGGYVTVSGPSGGEPIEWYPNIWWHGYQLIIPGEGSQDILHRDPSNGWIPSMTLANGTPINFPEVTKKKWTLGCLPSTANNMPGEGFLAVAPDGTQYKLDILVYKNAAPVVQTGRGGLNRRTVKMLASQATDRFGNWLKYFYDSYGNLTGIDASDGRVLRLTYEPWQHPSSSIYPVAYRVKTISLQSGGVPVRTWTYSYSSDLYLPRLTSVQLPDGSAWSFNLDGVGSAGDNELVSYLGCTYALHPEKGVLSSGTITHPSGLTGVFSVKSIIRGRSGVPLRCTYERETNFLEMPNVYVTAALVQKSYSGAGLGSLTWNYAYSGPNQSWIDDCGSSCVKQVSTDVTSPDGRGVRYAFSNYYDATESLLQRTDYYSQGIGTQVIRSEANSYANPVGGPWPAKLGSSLQLNVNDKQYETVAPLQQRILVQDGDTYTWQVVGFNNFAQALEIKRFNNIAGQSAVTEQTAYRNDLPRWVLGLPTKVTNVVTGEVESENVYSPAPSNPVLQSRSRFGQLLMSYTFNSAGQLFAFTDGKGNQTKLENYKRGIPQTITYPDTHTQRLVVDDLGQITSITDQADSTTSYSYDAIGRLKQISYPSGDEQAWYPSVFTYDYVTATERGLGANHWRRTVSKGNARAVTYFDALLRPVLSDSYIYGGAGSNISARTDYDWRGLKTFVSYPVAGSPNLSAIISGTTSSYDALGRLTQIQQAAEAPLNTVTSTTAYLSGARQQVTDPKGKVTTTSYQVFDQPSYGAVTKVQAPENVTQDIIRDLYGNPLSIRQSGLYATQSVDVTKTLTYDSYHRLCRTTEPESGSAVMAYDNANNLAWSAEGLAITGTGCGQEQVVTGKTTRSYDAMNRLLTLSPPVGTQGTIYTYDALGNPKTAESGISTWSATYNKRGQLTGEALQLTGQSAWAIGYAHDAYGSVSLIHYPDGENVSYAPDALGRATQVGSYATGLTYFPDGEVKDFDYGNGAVYAAEKNTRQLVSNFSYGQGATPVVSEDYIYDANGNITQVVDQADGPRSKVFGYDALNRLSSAQADSLWGTESYTYDPLNNLRTRITGGQTLTYNYDASNRLGSISGGAGSTFVYDNRGNVINKNGVNLVFDQKNQLTQIPGYGAYAYDATGRRVMKTPMGGSASTYYFYNQAGQLLHQVNQGTGKATNFVYLGRKLVARNDSLYLVAPDAISFDANPNDGSYTVSWSAVPGATSYLLQERANGGNWITVYSGSALSKALTGRDGGSYVYQVEGCFGTTCGAWTTSQTLGVRPALTTVSVPSGTINGTYSVSWTAPAGTTGYDVQERLDGGAWATIASNTAATAISRPGTTSGNYSYQVSAKNVHGSRGWAGSGAVTVDTTYGVIPEAPASLTVPISSSTGSATLSWDTSNLTTNYVVEQSSNGGASWTGVYNDNGTGTAVSGLADGNYVFHVLACNSYGCSPWTAGNATLVVTHPPATAPTVNAPTSSANGSYTVNWNAVGTATSYTLQEQVNGGSWATIQTGSAVSKVLSGKGNGSYGYQAQACNAGGCGPWSAIDSTMVLLPPAVPSSITVPATSSGSIAVSWVASATATSYTLQQRLGTGSWATAYTGASTSSVRTVTTSGSYTYQVQACNASGCSAYKGSSAVTVTIPPASAPSLSVPAMSNSGNYTVSWGGVSGATSYTLQEQANGGGWTTIQASNATSKAISGKGNGSYGYRAQASNIGGLGPWSGVVSITVSLIPLPPANVQAVDDFPNSKTERLTITWMASTGATRYDVHYLQTGEIRNVGTALSLIVEIGPEGTIPLNSYEVRACNAVGCSAWAFAN